MPSLEHVTIVGFGGNVLWRRSFSDLRRDAVSQLIENVLLEDRASDGEYTTGDYKLRWVLENERKYTVVGVYHRFLQLVCLDALLMEIASAFVPFLNAANVTKFDTVFDALFVAFEDREKKARGGSGPSKFRPSIVHDDDDEEEEEAAAPEGTTGSANSPGAMVKGGGGSTTFSADGAQVTTAGGRVITRRGAAPAPKKTVAAPAPAGGRAGGKPGKEPRLKDDAVATPTAAVPRATEEQLNADAERVARNFIQRDAQGKEVRVDEKNWSAQQPERGRLGAWLRKHVGVNRALDAQDFAGIVPQLREKLIAKNVAVEIAETVCDSVQASLTGTRVGTFDNLEACIERGMTDALCRILRPRREINILRSVAAAQERKKPYVIVFCGVNGVGKSTTLSKVCYWLKQNGHSVLLAAGDTFRHGAVEQLAVHARALKVPLFESGYGTDPSAVATQAIDQATRSGIDVVLVDTAGRMQDHEPRMRALANLIHNNRPDLVLFVGEALVGNTGVDQLRKFNKCLMDFAPVGAPNRGIDGIVLTKFDTIDDKVGATVTMVYELGQPILFVGVGQTYQDLKTIEPEVVVEALMN